MRRLFSLLAFMLGILVMSSVITAPEAKADDGSAVVVADDASPGAVSVQATAADNSLDGIATSAAFKDNFTSPPMISLIGDAATGGSAVPTLESQRILVRGHPPNAVRRKQ